MDLVLLVNNTDTAGVCGNRHKAHHRNLWTRHHSRYMDKMSFIYSTIYYTHS